MSFVSISQNVSSCYVEDICWSYYIVFGENICLVLNLTLAFQLFFTYGASELTLLCTLVRFLCRPRQKEFETGNPIAFLFDVCYWA